MASSASRSQSSTADRSIPIDSGKTAIDQITFYPTGRVQPASVEDHRVGDGESVTITCAMPADDFAIEGL